MRCRFNGEVLTSIGTGPNGVGWRRGPSGRQSRRRTAAPVQGWEISPLCVHPGMRIADIPVGKLNIHAGPNLTAALPPGAAGGTDAAAAGAGAQPLSRGGSVGGGRISEGAG